MKIKPYQIQFIENFKLNLDEIPGINIPKLSAKTSTYGGATTSGGTNSKMHASAGQLFQAALVTVALDTSDLSNDVTNDTTNYKMTITKAGYYLLVGKITWDAPVADKSYWTYLYKNGSALNSMVTQPSVNTAFSGIVTDLVYLDVGDYIQLKGYQNSGGNVYSRAETNLFICKI